MVQLCLNSCRSAFLKSVLSILALAALANAQTASLSLGSGAGVPASNVTVDLTLASGGTQPVALQWTLQYSPTDITGVTAALGAAASSAGKSLSCTVASGSATCVIFGINQSTIADGAAAQLTFALSPATTNTSSAIQVTQVVLSDATGASIPVAVSAGSITIVQPAVIVSGLSCSPSTLSPSGTSACVVTLNKPATGSSVVALTSSSANVSVPASVTASAGSTTANFTATAGSFNTDGSAQVTASLNGSAASASLTLTALSQVSAVSCTPATLNPNGKSTCLVTLSKPAPASGAVIALASSSASVSVPASVTAGAGATSATFAAVAGSFTTSGSAQITASLNGPTQAFTLTLAASPQIQISSVTCSPATFNGGSSSTCKVTLSSAPTSNCTILLSSNAANVTVPSTVAIPSGHASVQFTAASKQVDVDTNALVTASFNGSSQSTALTVIGVRPTALSCSPLSLSAGGSATCTVQLNRTPQTKLTLLLASSSASVTVPQSLSTRSQQTQYSFTARAAKFAAPGTVQLSATYLTSVASVNVTVLAPAAPALAAPTRMTTTAGTAVNVAAQAVDLSGLNVNLSAGNLPAGATFTTSPATTGVAGVIQWVPSADQVGAYSVILGAQSAAGTTSQKVAIDVASPVPHIDAVLNAASLSTQQVCSPGSLAIIQGTALQTPALPGRGSAGLTTLTINGSATRIMDASATQITFRCPQGNPGQKFTIQVTNRFGASNTANLAVQDATPGIFTLDGSGAGQGVIFVNGTSDVAALPDPDFLGQTAGSGDTLTILMTGLPDGPAAGSGVRVTIGQITAEVLSMVDAPLYPGLQMLTVTVPQNVPVGESVPVQVISQAQNAQSNTVTIAIEQADQ